MPLKRRSLIFLKVLVLLLLLLLPACSQPQPTPEPLKGFFEKVTALVTSTIRTQLRDNLPKQKLFVAQLPSLEKAATMNQLVEELKGVDPLKDLGYLIEVDIIFEFQKPEHQQERNDFSSPEFQRQLVSSILAGMNRALNQLKGGKDGK